MKAVASAKYVYWRLHENMTQVAHQCSSDKNNENIKVTLKGALKKYYGVGGKPSAARYQT